ncbi:MAG: hypothetical protein AB7S69_06355 [Salinivirgaceae bacterium]
METTNNLKIVNTRFVLNQKQISYYKNELKKLKNDAGIVSLCLDEKSLFIEYSKKEISSESIINSLVELNFPMQEKLSQIENVALVS